LGGQVRAFTLSAFHAFLINNCRTCRASNYLASINRLRLQSVTHQTPFSLMIEQGCCDDLCRSLISLIFHGARTTKDEKKAIFSQTRTRS
jgi:hypothetical protein